MKKEYDFSKGTRGKFYRKKAELHVPVYLDSDNYSFVSRIAEKKNTDVSDVVNELIKQDQRIAQALS
jgi:hypothetical protein